ncbi:MAG: PIG-L family deacetylase [Oscillospiraceae bacterium]|jgi:LmbE family N-acetylglucosaminyl deacetylase|nr:PIG-L family deacetylase [Oscillospiraceae bacterium]
MKTLRFLWPLLALCALCLPRATLAAPAEDITKAAQITCSTRANQANRLSDRDYKTAWIAPKGKDAWVEIAVDHPLGGLYLIWADPPVPWVLEARRGNAWVTVGRGGSEGFVHEYMAVPEGDAHVRIRPEQPGASSFGFTELYALGRGDAPDWVQQWQPTVEKADIMLLCGHPDDEFLYMGGAIPTYAGQRGKAVLVVTMTYATRQRRSELLNALWMGGLRSYPVMGSYKDSMFNTLAAAYKAWGYRSVRTFVVDLLRRHQPDVLISHDVWGEYGHGAHRLCADVARYAVVAAADAGQYPDSAQAFGPWQVKKLYLHLYPENAITMDWRQPLSAFGGRTALDVAAAAYNQHASQQINVFHVGDDYKHSCAAFGLAFTTVGPDVAKNDFLENIP